MHLGFIEPELVQCRALLLSFLAVRLALLLELRDFIIAGGNLIFKLPPGFPATG